MHTQEIATSQSEPLWHIGRFACALSLQAEPPFLCALKDDESILEVTVHSALEAENARTPSASSSRNTSRDRRADGRSAGRIIWVREVPSCGTPDVIATDDAATSELVMRCRGCGDMWRRSERRSGRRYRLGHSGTPSIRVQWTRS